jgi:hypothetical protein
MSDRDVFPADVARNLQQPIPEVQQLRDALTAYDLVKAQRIIPDGDRVARASRALLAYVENEPARVNAAVDTAVNHAVTQAWDDGYYATENTPNPYRSGGQTNG